VEKATVIPQHLERNEKKQVNVNQKTIVREDIMQYFSRIWKGNDATTTVAE